MRLMEHVAHMRSEMHTKFLVGKPEEKMPLGRPRQKWKGI
jgi:hypothetical protein